MNVSLFGGTFDPIHLGHMALARAARERYDLSRILFVPANIPPHKQHQAIVAYFHRYAMVVLATMGENALVPSLLEAPGLATGPPPTPGNTGKQVHGGEGPNYSIDTVRRLRQSLRRTDRVFMLIGIDAFSEIATWHKAEELFRECEFIVAGRPGYSLADVANALPEGLRPAPAVTKPFARQPARGDLVWSGVSLHLLEDVHQPISATAIRQAAAAKKPLKRFVPGAVEEYIKKMGLYS
jgi:nicotinate-nucleotide adenylyltransferase